MQKAGQSIHRAIEIAESIKDDDVCIYSFSRTYGEMIPADEFIRHMNNCLRLIDSAIENETGRKKDKIIGASGKNAWTSLMTLNF